MRNSEGRAMAQTDTDTLLHEFVEGRTDLGFELLAAGLAATAADKDGVSLLQWAAYYGDVSAMKFLLSRGANIESLGDDRGLNAAVYHGHWRLTKFLIEQGADVNRADPETGETALHSAVSKTDRMVYDLVLKVLLAHGANPNVATKNG